MGGMGAAAATAVATAVQRGVASGAGALLGLDLAAVGSTGASLFLGVGLGRGRWLERTSSCRGAPAFPSDTCAEPGPTGCASDGCSCPFQVLTMGRFPRRRGFI